MCILSVCSVVEREGKRMCGLWCDGSVGSVGSLENGPGWELSGDCLL